MTVAAEGPTRGQRLPRSARRAQLLEAAQAAFVEYGYHAAAMDEIADRAGVSKPVLYQHFPGKLDLYLALLDHHRGLLEEAVRTALASTTDNKQRVLACVEAYFEFVSRQGAPFRLLFESDLTNEPAVAERIEGVALTCGEALAQVIAADTDLSDADAHLLGMALTGAAGSVCAAVPVLGWIVWFLVAIVLLVFWVMGLISAVQGEMRPVPVLGEHYQRWFAGVFA